MCEDKPKVPLSDLITAAVCYLQEKNGVRACEIANFVARKRGCKLRQIESMIRLILCKGKSQGIFCEKKGLYRIEPRYDDAPKSSCDQVCISDDEDEEDDDEDEVESDGEEVPTNADPCACLTFSKEVLEEDDQEERCPTQNEMDSGANAKKPAKISASELILSAIFYLQHKNGVTAKDITKYISQKRGCKQSVVKDNVKKVLDRATDSGIFSKKKGLYRIESDSKEEFEDPRPKPQVSNMKTKKSKNYFVNEPVVGPPDPFEGRKSIENVSPTLKSAVLWKRSSYLIGKGFSAHHIQDSEARLARDEEVETVYFDPTIQLAEEEDDDTDFLDEEDEDDDDVDFFEDDPEPRQSKDTLPSGVEKSKSQVNLKKFAKYLQDEGKGKKKAAKTKKKATTAKSKSRSKVKTTKEKKAATPKEDKSSTKPSHRKKRKQVGSKNKSAPFRRKKQQEQEKQKEQEEKQKKQCEEKKRKSENKREDSNESVQKSESFIKEKQSNKTAKKESPKETNKENGNRDEKPNGGERETKPEEYFPKTDERQQKNKEGGEQRNSGDSSKTAKNQPVKSEAKKSARQAKKEATEAPIKAVKSRKRKISQINNGDGRRGQTKKNSAKMRKYNQ